MALQTLYSTLVEAEPPLAQRYPHTHMHDLEQNAKQAFERYMLHLDRLHWRTEPEENLLYGKRA